MARLETWPENARERWPNFSHWEVSCRCGCGALPAEEFIDFLQKMRWALRRPIRVTSMMRCPEYNGQISSTGSEGPHTTGYAADIACSQIEFLEIFQYAANNHVMRIGFQQAGRDHTRYIHLDICDKRFPGMFNPAVWQY